MLAGPHSDTWALWHPQGAVSTHGHIDIHLWCLGTQGHQGTCMTQLPTRGHADPRGHGHTCILTRPCAWIHVEIHLCKDIQTWTHTGMQPHKGTHPSPSQGLSAHPHVHRKAHAEGHPPACRHRHRHLQQLHTPPHSAPAHTGSPRPHPCAQTPRTGGHGHPHTDTPAPLLPAPRRGRTRRPPRPPPRAAPLRARQGRRVSQPPGAHITDDAGRDAGATGWVARHRHRTRRSGQQVTGPGAPPSAPRPGAGGSGTAPAAWGAPAPGLCSPPGVSAAPWPSPSRGETAAELGPSGGTGEATGEELEVRTDREQLHTEPLVQLMGTAPGRR